jgi:hypothetical protein
MIVRSGAYTPYASMTGAQNTAGYDHLDAPQELLHRYNIYIIIQEITGHRAPKIMRRQIHHLRSRGPLHHNVTHRRGTERGTVDATTTVDR